MKARKAQFAPESTEARNVEAALAASGLNWNVDFKPLFLEKEDSIGGIEQASGIRALVRSDNGRPVGYHGGAYTPVQQSEAFAGIQPLLDAGEARIVACGALEGGKKVFIEAEIGTERPKVKVGDVIRQLAVFANSHDGTSPCTVAYVLERLACLNGMTRPERSQMFRGRHTRGIHAALEAWRVEFAEQRDLTERRVATWRTFARRRLDRRNLTRYVRETLSEGAADDTSIVVRGVDRIVELAETAPGADPGTLWGGLNAVTYWATHERGRSDDARDTANMFGNGGALIERAQAVAVIFAPDLPESELGRASYANHATARAEFQALLGGSYIPSAE